MKNLANFLLFQLAWFAAVEGAARGSLWGGPLAVAVIVIVHLALVTEKGRELRYLLVVGLLGTAVDSGLFALDITAYPGTASTWSGPFVPPWIVSLWVAFATLPRFSMAWLVARPALAALLGAVGGPLSFYAGVRIGAVAPGGSPLLTAGVLALEYAVATPLLLALSRHGKGPMTSPAHLGTADER